MRNRILGLCRDKSLEPGLEGLISPTGPIGLIKIVSLLLVSTLAYPQSAKQPNNIQAWEKLLVPGLSYRMEYHPKLPLTIHALRFSTGAPDLKARCELAKLVVYTADETKGRGELSELVKRTGAIAAINGDFFPWTGKPLGGMVRDGELLSKPFPTRAVFAWGPKMAQTALLKWSASLLPEGGQPIKITGLNEEVGDNDLVLFTPASGLALAKQPATFVILKASQTKLGTSSKMEVVLSHFNADQERLPVEEGTLILAARGKAQEALKTLQQNQKITLELRTDGLDWERFDNAIGGGPFLVKAGKIYVDWQQQGFKKDSFVDKRHPRSAIGRTAEGDVWLVTVDGRQETSAGLTLDELAQVMLRLGCYEAINLDGGGSSTLNIFGLTMNRPSDSAERKISNGFLIFGSEPSLSSESEADRQLAIQGPARLTPGKAATYKVIGPDGKQVPNRLVIWSVQWPAWIDQGGTLKAHKAGAIMLQCRVIGQTLTLSIRVEEPQLSPSKAKEDKPQP